MPPVPFIIMADLRTGSTLVSTTLDHHPEARCLGELFHPQNLPDNCPPGINRFDMNGKPNGAACSDCGWNRFWKNRRSASNTPI